MWQAMAGGREKLIVPSVTLMRAAMRVPFAFRLCVSGECRMRGFGGRGIE
jgi:hypothetical protein